MALYPWQQQAWQTLNQQRGNGRNACCYPACKVSASWILPGCWRSRCCAKRRKPIISPAAVAPPATGLAPAASGLPRAGTGQCRRR